VAPTLECSIHQNLLDVSATHLLETAADQLPDLRAYVVFVPQSLTSTAFRQQLLKASNSSNPKITAIFPPWVGTLKDWVNEHIAVTQPYSLISEQTRRLVFIDALKDYPHIFQEENKWQVTVALLKLFDELSLEKAELNDAKQWQQLIHDAYGIDEHKHCNQEAHLVFSLWHAWHQQLEDNHYQDLTGDYVSRLIHATGLANNQTLTSNQTSGKQHFIVIGENHFSRCERNFITALQKNNQCTLIKHSDDISATCESAETAYTYFIQQCYNFSSSSTTALSLQQRVASIPSKHLKHVPYSCFMAADDETQVRAIDCQVRQWLIEKRQNIGIICEDRKLARRLRALLDRADVSMQDFSGWSLATTQAATIVERWLQCIENDFDSRPLLECLKSPFVPALFESLSFKTCNDVSPDTSNDTGNDALSDEQTETSQQDKFKYLVYRFEHDIVLHENINSNLDRYRKQLARRKKRLSHWSEENFQNIVALIDKVETVATPLQQLYQSQQTKPASVFFTCFKKSLEQLGVLNSYAQDAAGLRILQTLDDLETSLNIADPIFSWQDFRLWLGNALEEKLFSPNTQNSPVKLMTSEQADCLEFDALIIAAVEPQFFPGKANNSPFFNQSVRAALGLSCWQQDYEKRFKQFKTLLFSAPEILITCRAQDKGETIPVSPWLELLIQFHQQVFNTPPFNTQLPVLLDSNVNNNADVFRCDTNELPTQLTQPTPSLNETLIPQKFSASSHQRLINCPYLFFCSDGLKLRPLEEISTELSKSDYGERIHAILQCFHQTDDSSATKNKKAFKENITESNRKKAELHLEELSAEFFNQDLEENALHRSWLQRWIKHIPSYISWQIEQQRNWKVLHTEQQIEEPLLDSFSLYGRLDRIDKNTALHDSESNNQYSIIDYKTGRSAKQSEVESGEDVQLTTYALLNNDCSNVMYLSLDSSYHQVKTGASLSEEMLEDYRELTRQRLNNMINAITEQHELPAWGDDKACSYCRFSGVCRRQQWHE